MKIKCFLLLLLVSVFSSLSANAETALKTNLIYDATTTPNIGIEMGVGKMVTAQLFYGLNPWTFSTDSHGDKKAKHWLLMPELRLWTCTKFNGQFFGVHLMGGQFNAANVNIPLPGFFVAGENIRSGARDYRYQGAFAGLGLTYGWQWILSRHINIEAEIGVGYNHAWYSKYPCYECGSKIDDGGTNYLGVTKLGLSFLYIF